MKKHKRMNISFFSLTKNQTNIMKGTAMIVLVLHNYLHLGFGIAENEFKFNPNNIFGLFSFINSDYKSIFSCLISYFGFYAVQLFIVLSGFGLVKQSIKEGETPFYKYLLPKIIKIYSLLIVGFIIFYCGFFFIENKVSTNDILSTILMYKNFSFDTIFAIAGPWWYFSLIIQLYILYPLLYQILLKYKEKGGVAMIVVSYILIFLLTPLAEAHNFPMFGNALGHLPEFLLGMYLAIFKTIRINWKVCIIAFMIFVLSNFYTFFSPFRFLSVSILILVILYPLINIENIHIKKGLIYLGSISMFMFVINGPLRSYTHYYMTDKSYIIQFLLSLLHLSIVILDAMFISFIYKRTLRPIDCFLIKKISSDSNQYSTKL